MRDDDEAGHAIRAHDAVIQESHKTRPDRYPVVFGCVAELMRTMKRDRPRILSFGCSTGDEAATLGARYFPDATVIGVDIDPDVIATARALHGRAANVQFFVSGERAFAPRSFHVIFAMSVLCRWPETRQMDDIAAVYPFGAFEQQVAYLDSLLRPGGLLVIYNANYSFLQSRVSARYDLMTHPSIKSGGMVQRFGKDGRPRPDLRPSDCIYRKQRASAPRKAGGLLIRDQHLRRIALLAREDDTAE